MKKIALITLSILFLCAPISADSSVAVFASYWDTDVLGEAVGLGIRGSYGGERWFFDFGTTYFQETDALKFVIGSESLELPINFSVVDLGLRRRFAREAVRPYVAIGLSYFDFQPALQPDVSDELGYYGLVGFELGRGRIGFVGEAVYRNVDGEVDLRRLKDEPIDQRIGVDLDGLVLHAGLVFRIGR